MIGFAELLSAPGQEAAAAEFYSAVLGWTVNSMPGGDPCFMLFATFPDGQLRPAAEITSGDPGSPASWTPYAMVPNYDQVLAAALARGAQLLASGTHSEPPMRWAVIRDPFGVQFGISEQPPPGP